MTPKAFSFVLAFLAACTSVVTNKPTNADADAYVAPAVCERFEACFPVDFVGAYGSHEVCVDRFQHLNPDPTAEGACTSAEVEKCAADIRALTCTLTRSAFVLPPSCKGCG